MKKEEKKATYYLVEVQSKHRKAFQKVMNGLKEAEIISHFQEQEEKDPAKSGTKKREQNEQIRQYHDLLD